MSKLGAQSPMDDLTYDVLTVLQKKAKALEAYDTYVSAAWSEEDEELEDLFTQMRKRDAEDRRGRAARAHQRGRDGTRQHPAARRVDATASVIS